MQPYSQSFNNNQKTEVVSLLQSSDIAESNIHTQYRNFLNTEYHKDDQVRQYSTHRSYISSALQIQLDLPRRSHHQIKVSVFIDRSTYSSIIVQKFFFCDLKCEDTEKNVNIL